jgi:hypothetical protein
VPWSSSAEIRLVVYFLGLDVGIEMLYHALDGVLLGVEKIRDFEHFHYPVLFAAQVDLYLGQYITLVAGRLALGQNMIRKYINIYGWL